METSVATTSLAGELEEHGIVVLPDFVSGEQLAHMQEAFAICLKRMRWNNFDGFEKTEPYRHMVQNVLTLDQGFVDLALHPVIKTTLRDYIGPAFELVEAKGWLSLPTTENFHGWHGDAWYDHSVVPEPQREVKLAFYLTDVSSGAFNYLKGTHGKIHPRLHSEEEVRKEYEDAELVRAVGKAGTAILFDTSGIHRQECPILEPRHAVFLNYHDPSVPLQDEDVRYYRYHPLILNAAFLGGMDDEDRRILGFGNKTNYVRAFERSPKHERFQNTFASLFDAKLRLDRFKGRVMGKLRRN
jgi:hypothetical protein